MPEPSAATPRIELLDVRKAFGDNQVLAGVSLKVMPGESLVIIGGSGTGKSVTLKCILGILTARLRPDPDRRQPASPRSTAAPSCATSACCSRAGRCSTA